MGKPAFVVNISNKINKNESHNRNQVPSRSSGQNSRTKNNKRKIPKLTGSFTNIRQGFNSTVSSVSRFKRQLKWNRIRIIVGILLVVMFILQIVCTATPSWLNYNDVHEQGIWRVCTQVKDEIECLRYNVMPSYFKPIQAMMVVSIFIYILGFVYFVYMLQRKTWPAFLLSICIAVAGILTLSSLSLFTDQNLISVRASDLNFGWGYFIGWLNVLISVIASVVVIWDYKYL